MTPYCYILVRTDLSPAQQLVQSCHAAMEATHKYGLPERTHLVVCELSESIEYAEYYLSKHGVQFQTFYENDISEHTAICTEPIYGDKRNLFKKFNLLK